MSVPKKLILVGSLVFLYIVHASFGRQWGQQGNSISSKMLRKALWDFLNCIYEEGTTPRSSSKIFIKKWHEKQNVSVPPQEDHLRMLMGCQVRYVCTPNAWGRRLTHYQCHGHSLIGDIYASVSRLDHLLWLAAVMCPRFRLAPYLPMSSTSLYARRVNISISFFPSHRHSGAHSCYNWANWVLWNSVLYSEGLAIVSGALFGWTLILKVSENFHYGYVVDWSHLNWSCNWGVVQMYIVRLIKQNGSIRAIIVYWTNAFIQHFPHPYYYVPGQNGCFRAILVYWVMHTVF